MHQVTRHNFMSLGHTRAGLEALVKRVMKLGIVSTSAFSKPRTPVTTATDFSRFSDDATFRTYGIGSSRCSECPRLSVATKHHVTRRSFTTPGRTRAGLHALDPRVSRTGARTSAFLEPRTTASAATAFAGLFEGGALGAHGADPLSDDWLRGRFPSQC